MNNPIYLDYCATTPVHAEVRTVMMQALEVFGNPSSMHWAGQSAARLMQDARFEVAAGIGCDPQEIIFTSGATEADNLALLGVVRQHPVGQAHLITSAVEHHANLHAADALLHEGYAVTILPVNGEGLVDPEAVRSSIRPDTVLISIMMVNNEIGAVQPIAEIGQIARQHNILFHTDAVQALGLFDVNVDALNLDLLSLSAHKIYGPKGIGALYVRQGTSLAPVLHGGPQERQIRPGTENLPGIVGLGAAVKWVTAHKSEESVRLTGLRAYAIDRLRELIPDVVVNGPRVAYAPHVLSLSFPGTDSEAMLFRLNRAGIAVSLGSACNSQTIEPSHVLSAMGLPESLLASTLRVSLGSPTTPDDIDSFTAAIVEIHAMSRVA